MIFPTISASLIKIKSSCPMHIASLKRLHHYHHHILNTYKMQGETDEKWTIKRVSFLPTRLGQSPNDSVSILVLRVFRFNWIKYCFFDISSLAVIWSTEFLKLLCQLYQAPGENHSAGGRTCSELPAVQVGDIHVCKYWVSPLYPAVASIFCSLFSIKAWLLLSGSST